MTRRYSGDEGGQVIVLIAIAIAALVLGIGLALDTGQLFVSRRAMQTASDAAAWAGATILYAGGSAAAAQTAATTDATRNGYTTATGTTVTAVSPPTTGIAANDPGYIEVTITRTVPTTFIRPPSGAGTQVKVRSVAGLARSGAGTAVMALNGAVASALNVTGGGFFTITGGPTQTNSTSGTAVSVGTACGAANCLSATAHRVRGNVNAATLGRMSPAPVTGALPALLADPFAAVAGPPNAANIAGSTITTLVDLYPGVYTSLVSVNSGGTARLNGPVASPTSPGIYIFQAGLRTQGTGSLILPAVTGGVLIYNANASYPAAGGGCGAITLGGSGQHRIAAPKTGSYAGMLIYQNPTCANAASITMRGALSSYSGTMYLPAATLTLTISNNTAIASQIVSNQLTVATGGNTLTMNFTPSAITGTRVPALIE